MLARLFDPGERAASVETDAALENAVFPPGHDVGRHRVEQFVGHHHAGKCLRQAIQPFDPGQQMRRGPVNGVALPLPQIGRQIEDEITLGQGLQALQFEQQVGSQPS